MKKHLFVFLITLFSFTSFGQITETKTDFNGTLNVFGVSGSSPTFTITGFFNDQRGFYASTDVTVGDIFWDVDCNRFVISSINSNTGGIIDAIVTDLNTAGSLSSGVGAIMTESQNNSYPLTIPGISETVQGCIQTHFALLVDEVSGIDTAYVSGDSLYIDNIGLELEDNQQLTWNNPTRTLSIEDGNAVVIPDNEGMTNFMLDGNTGSKTVDNADIIQVFGQNGISTNASGNTVSHQLDVTFTGGLDNLSDVTLSSPSPGETIVFDGTEFVNQQFTTQDQIYVSNEAIIRASGAGVTWTNTGGTGTLSIPDGIQVKSFRVSGTTGDLLAGDYTIRILQNGTPTHDTGLTDYFPPIVQVINTASQLGGGPSVALPFVYDEGSDPQIQIIGINTGSLEVNVANLNAFSNWSIVCSL